MIPKERVKALNSETIRNRDYVVYWMQQSQRVEYNHALEYAVLQANKVNRPLVVYFGLIENFPEANIRHYQFMLEGLKETQRALYQRRIKLVVRRESPHAGIAKLAENDRSIEIMGYFSHQLSAKEKSFFLDSLEKYKTGRLPLSACTNILKAWIVRFQQEYLTSQTFLEPYPEELAPSDTTTNGEERDYWK